MKMRIKLTNNETGEPIYDDSFALEGTYISTI